MKTGYAIKDGRGYFFKEFSVFGMELADKYKIKHASDVMVLDSLSEAKELAKTLATSKWLNTVEFLESEYYVVWVELTEESESYEHKSWLHKLLRIPPKKTSHPAKLFEKLVIWSTDNQPKEID